MSELEGSLFFIVSVFLFGDITSQLHPPCFATPQTPVIQAGISCIDPSINLISPCFIPVAPSRNPHCIALKTPIHPLPFKPPEKKNASMISFVYPVPTYLIETTCAIFIIFLLGQRAKIFSRILLFLPSPDLGEEVLHVHPLALHLHDPRMFQHPPGSCAASGFFLETVGSLVVSFASL